MDYNISQKFHNKYEKLYEHIVIEMCIRDRYNTSSLKLKFLEE